MYKYLYTIHMCCKNIKDIKHFKMFLVKLQTLSKENNKLIIILGIFSSWFKGGVTFLVMICLQICNCLNLLDYWDKNKIWELRNLTSGVYQAWLVWKKWKKNMLLSINLLLEIQSYVQNFENLMGNQHLEMSSPIRKKISCEYIVTNL